MVKMHIINLEVSPRANTKDPYCNRRKNPLGLSEATMPISLLQALIHQYVFSL